MKLQLLYQIGDQLDLEGANPNKFIDYYNEYPLSMFIDKPLYIGSSRNSTREDVERNPDLLHVVIELGSIRERGRTHDINEFKTTYPVVTLSWRGLRIFGPFKRMIARWVLKHEFGHVRGLEHHFNPFCLMCPINVSCGRFCKRCYKQLERS
jgi:hypothetical protein